MSRSNQGGQWLGFKPADEERGRDVIGQVGANARGPRLANKLGQINFQRIAFDGFEPAWIVMCDLGKRREAARVALDRDDFLRALGEQRSREPAGARADLNDRRIGQGRRGARDAAGQIEIEKKILAQGFLGKEPMRGGDLAQRWQTIEVVVSGRSRS